MSRRVVVTGTGVLSPIGNSTHEFLNGLKNGVNGIGPITSFDTSAYSVHIAGEVKINLEDYFESRELNRMDRFTAMALIASTEAVARISASRALVICAVGKSRASWAVKLRKSFDTITNPCT